MLNRNRSALIDLLNIGETHEHKQMDKRKNIDTEQVDIRGWIPSFPMVANAGQMGAECKRVLAGHRDCLAVLIPVNSGL